MKKSITKTQIMKALKREPLLKRNNWFGYEPSIIGAMYKENCSVCAVGSVLRAMSFEKWVRKIGLDLHHLGNVAVKKVGIVNDINMVKIYLKNKNYLAALSCFYESGKTRNQCISFVDKNFPDKLTVILSREDINAGSY